MTRESRPSWRCSGVGGGRDVALRAAMSPSSVVAPVADDLRASAPACDRRPCEDRRVDGFRDGQRLPRQRRLVQLQPLGRDHVAVRRDAVTLAQDNEIAGNDLCCRDLSLAPVPDHEGCRQDRAPQREHRAFGACFLQQPEQGVQEHDRRDHGRLEPFSDEKGDRGSRDQEHDERVGQLSSGDPEIARP